MKIRLAAAAVLLVAAAQGSAPAPAAGQAPLRPLAVTQLDERQQGSDLDRTRPVSITLSEPVPIADLLLMLVRDTRLSVVPDPDVQGTFRGELRDVTLRQALEMIVRPHGYDYVVEGSVIRVFKRRLETRRFDLNYVITRRVGSRSISATSAMTPSGGPGAPGAPQAQGSSAAIASTDAGDLFADLGVGVQTLLSPEGRFNLDRKAALLQATDYPDRLDQVQLYLDAVHARASRQVQIQAKVIEVALHEQFAAGIDWPLLIKRAGDSVSLTQNAAPVPGGTMTAGLNIKDLPGLLAAFASQGTVNVIASPTVHALNNEPVLVRIGTQDVFFRTTTQADAATGRVLQTTEPQAITEGVVLSVTPQISSDGTISMSITPSVTERTGQATSRFGDRAPILSVREADTLMRVHENETIVIAGLLEERITYERTKVPVLGDIPGVGAIFRGETPSRRKTDLVILLTPRVIAPARILETDAKELDRVSTR